MHFFMFFMIAIFITFITIGVVILTIISKFKSAVGDVIDKEVGEIGNNSFKDIVSAMHNLEQAEYTREKTVKDMTSVLENEILRDFPDFNKNYIFSVCQSNLLKIFNAIEEKDITRVSEDENLAYLKDYVSEKIEDMKSSGIREKFDDIQFYKHAICSYAKKQGIATVKISSTLSYYYDTNRKDKKFFPGTRKQTRYMSEFVYIYDEAKIGNSKLSFSTHCPNCGAPLKNIKNNICEYCSSYVEKVNHKIWKMTSYKEDYK